MIEAPSGSELAARSGISRSYASEIVNGVRKPSRPLAIHILRRTGWLHDSIASLTEEQIATLEAVEPWAPATPQTAEAA